MTTGVYSGFPYLSNSLTVLTFVLIVIHVIIIESATEGTTVKEVPVYKEILPEESYFVKDKECHIDTARENRLNLLRRMMKDKGVDAYIIPNENENQFKLSDYDRRIQSISGFSGLIGTAVVTKEHAVIWTDGRTFLQATEETDCGWSIYRKGGSKTVALADFVSNHLESGDSVAACPFLISAVWWHNFDIIFKKRNITLRAFENDLIDQVWIHHRPPRPSTTMIYVPVQFSGQSWQEKIRLTIRSMEQEGADLLVLSNLDEIAWLFNLRADNFMFDPYFFAFAIVDIRHKEIRLYILDATRKLRHSSNENITIFQHLNTSPDGLCPSQQRSCKTIKSNFYTKNEENSCVTGSEVRFEAQCVNVIEYNSKSFIHDVTIVANNPYTEKVWVSWNCNHAIYKSIPKEKIHQNHTPPLILKAQKNAVEIQGMRDATIRDSAFLVGYFASLEKRITDGEEIRVNNIVYEISSLRRQLKYYYGPSCMVLSGFGPNSAPLRPKITDEIITENNTYLFDSGGQFLDGTTDIGRTYHFGSPNDKEKEIYTRLLMTHINLASKVWWDVRTGRELDTDGIRKPLHDIGLDFPHESGHMISAFGVIVEGPASISSSKSDWKSDVNIDTDIFNFSNVSVSEELLRYPDYRDYPLAEGMCFSNEPSYYGNGDFGMRIENTMVIKKVIVKESSSDHLFEFEQFTMVPFEQKLIKRELLTDKQVNWVNNYHNRVRETLRPILEAKGDRLGLKWMNKKTQYIH